MGVLSNLRKLSDKQKRVYAFLGALVLTLLIVLLWFLWGIPHVTVGYRWDDFSEGGQINALKANVQSAASQIGAGMSELKTLTQQATSSATSS